MGVQMSGSVEAQIASKNAPDIEGDLGAARGKEPGNTQHIHIGGGCGYAQRAKTKYCQTIWYQYAKLSPKALGRYLGQAASISACVLNIVCLA